MSAPANHHIMVVDDEPDVLHVIGAYLKKWGFFVDGFTSPLQALENFKSHPLLYSLVIFDLRMAELNGFELAERISQINPAVKLMIITANVSDLIKVPNSLQDKINNESVLEKPAGMKQVCDSVKRKLNLI